MSEPVPLKNIEQSIQPPEQLEKFSIATSDQTQKEKAPVEQFSIADTAPQEEKTSNEKKPIEPNPDDPVEEGADKITKDADTEEAEFNKEVSETISQLY